MSPFVPKDIISTVWDDWRPECCFCLEYLEISSVPGGNVAYLFMTKLTTDVSFMEYTNALVYTDAMELAPLWPSGFVPVSVQLKTRAAMLHEESSRQTQTMSSSADTPSKLTAPLVAASSQEAKVPPPVSYPIPEMHGIIATSELEVTHNSLCNETVAATHTNFFEQTPLPALETTSRMHHFMQFLCKVPLPTLQ